MGWNQGYTILEAQVVSLYDQGALTPEVLDLLLAPFRNTDIDSGGSRDLTSADGLSFDEILLKVAAAPDTQAKLAAMKAALPSDELIDQLYDPTKEEQSSEYKAAQEAVWDYEEALYKAVADITQF